MAEQYISAFKHLAKTNNTLILPSNAGDISSLVTQALSVYKTVSAQSVESIAGPTTAASTEHVLKASNENSNIALTDSFNNAKPEPDLDVRQKKIQSGNSSKVEQ